jgi:undecaprenyl-diphosphatase
MYHFMATVAQLVRVSVCGTESRGFESRQSPIVFKGIEVPFWKALILGIVQGITEFFPVSSSAHLKLIKFFFDIKEAANFHMFDLFCHLGTLLAAIIFLRKEIFQTLKNTKDTFLILLAILPLIPFYFLMKPLREYLSKDIFLGMFLILTAAMLFITSSYKRKENEITYKRKIKDVLLIGCMQAMALMPGLSRSGATITAAHIRGWKIQNSIKFSYLLAVPTIIGGTLLEGVKEIKHASLIQSSEIFSYFIAFLSSFVVGLFAIKLLFKITNAKKFRAFAWYLLIVGCITLVYVTQTKSV